jgi:hypothetical protein
MDVGLPPSVSSGDWLLDVRYACRSLLARPAFSLVVVLTLAIAIGANTPMYGVLRAVVFNPLPFRDPDRIVVLSEYAPTIETQFVSPVTYDDWKTRNEAFTGIAAFRYCQTVNLEDTGRPGVDQSRHRLCELLRGPQDCDQRRSRRPAATDARRG